MDTREKLRRILTEWSEFRMPPLYGRAFNDALLRDARILTVIGPRRAGKTCLCYQLIQRVRKRLPAGNVIYINLEDERLHPFKGDELTLLLETQRELFAVDDRQAQYVVVDEVQNAPYWSKWARRVTEQNPRMHLILTGSSSALLSREIATELRGRARSFTVYPLSFAEYAGARGVQVEPSGLARALRGKTGREFKRLFNAYMRSGGFPEALHAEHPSEVLRSYYSVMFYRDMIERNKVKNIRLLEDFLMLLIDQTACLTSVSSTAKKLEECGYALSKNTLTAFLRYAVDVFLLFDVRRHSYKIKQQLAAPCKIYAIDHALVQAVRFSGTQDYGRGLENIVYLELRRRGEQVHYYKERHECDFVLSRSGAPAAAVQVCKSISDARTREREIRGLRDAMTALRLKKGVIITEDEHGEIGEEGGTITVVPAWYWLLGGGSREGADG